MSVSSFPLACQVVKLSQDELEIRFQQGFHLRPGQLLRFERDDGDRLYGRVDALRVEANRTEEGNSILAKIHVLLGEADLTLNQATVLSADGLKQEVSSLLGVPTHPLQLGDMTVDFKEYQTLTLLRGGALSDKLTAMAHWLEALNTYQHIVVIDPLGVVQDELLDKAPRTFANIVKGGIDASLSLQNVGIKRFLSVLATMLPDVIRNEAIQLLAEVLPIGQTFIPFRELLRVETLTERREDGPSRQALSMKTPLLNCLYDIDRQRVFADSPREVLSLPNILSENITVIDLSSLSEPWKSLFYDELCLEILSNAGSDIMPVLIYPENYLNDFSDYIKKLNEADISALAVASPYLAKDLVGLANNQVYWNTLGDIYLEGSLTFGLPVELDLHSVPNSWGELGDDFITKPQKPIQARYSQKAPVAAPTPAIAEEPIPYTIHLDESDVPLWFDESQEIASETFPADDIPLVQTSIEADDEEDDLGFDSILGAIDEFDTSKIQHHPYQERQDKESQAEELGGQVIRSEPEFISATELNDRAPSLANAMINAMHEQEAAELAFDDDDLFDDEGEDDVEPTVSSIPEATYSHQLEGAYGHGKQDEELLEDDFNFEFSWSDGEPSEAPSAEIPSFPVMEPEAAEGHFNSYNEPLTLEDDIIQEAETHTEENAVGESHGAPSTILSEPPPIVSRLEEEPLEITNSYQVGDRVVSDKYGEGVVQKLIPMDSTTAVHVLFDNGSKRTIVPSATNLQKA